MSVWVSLVLLVLILSQHDLLHLFRLIFTRWERLFKWTVIFLTLPSGKVNFQYLQLQTWQMTVISHDNLVRYTIADDLFAGGEWTLGDLSQPGNLTALLIDVLLLIHKSVGTTYKPFIKRASLGICTKTFSTFVFVTKIGACMGFEFSN